MKIKAFSPFLASFAIAIIISGALFAVTGNTARAAFITPSCTILSGNLSIGDSDSYQNGNVELLQTFLYDEGFLQHVPTGYFGELTYSAVVQLQGTYNIPTTGFVGPLTRAEIQALSCTQPTPVPTPIPTPAPVPTPVSNVTITGINPSQGPAGTVVTLTGYGFTTDNMINFAGGAIQNVSAGQNVVSPCVPGTYCTGLNEQYSLTFVVPSSIGPYCPPGTACPEYERLVTPGVYPISVTDQYGTSNQVDFTVTSSGTNGAPLSIASIGGPNSLPVYASGTWTVSVNDTENTNMNYSVSWGDGNDLGNNTLTTPSTGSVQSSATFSHTYEYPGTYTAVFTVTDGYGQTTTGSATVVVTPY